MTKKKVSLPVEGIPNLWIVYNGKAGISKGKKIRCFTISYLDLPL